MYKNPDYCIDIPEISNDYILDISKSCQSNYFCIFTKLPDLIFYIQSFSLPSTTNRKITINMPNHSSSFHIGGHTNEYEDFTVNFIMDENFKTYFSILDWMRKNEIEDEIEKQYGRMVLVILNNAKIPIIRVNARDVIPTSLGDITFNNQTSDVITYYASLSSYAYSVNYIDGSMNIPYHYGRI